MLQYAAENGSSIDASWCVLLLENEFGRWDRPYQRAAFAFVCSNLSGNNQRVKILIPILNACTWSLCIRYQIPQCGLLNAGKASLISLQSPGCQRLRNSLLAARVSTLGPAFLLLITVTNDRNASRPVSPLSPEHFSTTQVNFRHGQFTAT